MVFLCLVFALIGRSEHYCLGYGGESEARDVEFNVTGGSSSVNQLDDELALTTLTNH